MVDFKGFALEAKPANIMERVGSRKQERLLAANARSKNGRDSLTGPMPAGRDFQICREAVSYSHDPVASKPARKPIWNPGSRHPIYRRQLRQSASLTSLS